MVAAFLAERPAAGAVIVGCFGAIRGLTLLAGVGVRTPRQLLAMHAALTHWQRRARWGRRRRARGDARGGTGGRHVILHAHGIRIELPRTWSGRVFRAADGLATLHAGDFQLPLDDGEFGDRSTGAMPGVATFLALTEYEPGDGLIPGAGLFAPKRIRLPLDPTDFGSSRLQHPAPRSGRRPALLHRVGSPVLHVRGDRRSAPRSPSPAAGARPGAAVAADRRAIAARSLRSAANARDRRRRRVRGQPRTGCG